MTITTECQFQATRIVRALEERGLYVEFDPETSGVTLYTPASNAGVVGEILADLGTEGVEVRS